MRRMKNDKVMVLDAELRTMLSVIRSLARSGLKVISCSFGKSGGYLSRYSFKKFDLSDYSGNKWLAISEIAKIEKIGCIFTHLESTKMKTYEILREEIDSGKIVLIPPSISTIEIVSNKYNILRIAQEIGINVPKTVLVENPENLNLDFFEIELPIFGKVFCEIGLPPGPENRYIFVNNEKDLSRLEILVKKGGKVLVQEYVKGYGYGVGGLFLKGKPIAVGGHLRLREAFSLGGPSTKCVSVINKKALNYALELMRRIKYTGLGMVEFKIDEKGEPYLMEINPRIWGTFPLYIAAGLDLPLLAYKLFVNNEEISLNEIKFKEGVKMIFLLEDIKAIREQCGGFSKYIEILKDLFEIVFGISKEGTLEYLDYKPFLIPVISYLFRNFKKRGYV